VQGSTSSQGREEEKLVQQVHYYDIACLVIAVCRDDGSVTGLEKESEE